uniref:Uncharacterized protein n=1 Tax=Geobacter sp. (strain M21) TaxID=443144 RepID=C6E6T6_GEOSM
MFNPLRYALNKLKTYRKRQVHYQRWDRKISDHRAMSMAQRLLRTGALMDSRTTGCPLLRTYK